MRQGLTPPDGFSVRPATPGDAAAIADLMNEVTLAEAGFPLTTAEETRDELTSPARDPALPDVLLLDEDGSLAGYLQPRKTESSVVTVLAFVRPRLWGRGLNAWLIRLGEELATEWAGGTGVTAHVARFAQLDSAARLFRDLGYAYVRTFWMMRIDLAEAGASPDALRDGIRIRTFERGQDERPFYDAIAEAFADHWGSWSDTFEQWRHTNIDGEGAQFDPTLWFLAVDGNEVVGTACCSATTPRAEDTGVVYTLAVRRAWRRQGVALTLLRTAFAEMRRRGIANCELGVDAENPTGATRLYERAGMHIAYSWDIWEKTLDPSRVD